MKRGQVLVLVVLGLVAVLAFVGLAMDSGRVYQTRRLLQNAADAAAIAAALELATNRSNTTQASLWDKIAQYLQANGANPATSRAWLLQGDTRLVEISQSTSLEPPPSNANKVEVLTVRTIPVLFAGFLGQSQNTVRARAAPLWATWGLWDRETMSSPSQFTTKLSETPELATPSSFGTAI
jgi:Flp pilus assembly protein TadG